MLSDIIFHATTLNFVQFFYQFSLVESGWQLVELVILVVILLLINLDAFAEQVLIFIILCTIKLVKVCLL